MIKVVTRRLRCEVQGCHKRADFGLGIKGNDYPLCKEHAEMLFAEMKDMFHEPKKSKKTLETKEETKNEPEILKETEEIKEEVKEEEFYVCKYCGEKFDKKEMSAAKFATHVRQCKLQHQYED